MRRTFILLFLIMVLLLTACSQSGTISEDESSSEYGESSSENSENLESGDESSDASNVSTENSADEDVIVLHSETFKLPYLTLPADHNWDNIYHNIGDTIPTFITSHPVPMLDRGLEEIIFDGIPPAEYLPEGFPAFPDEFEIIDCRQEKNGLYITIASYGDYTSEFLNRMDNPNGYYGWIGENPTNPVQWPTFYNSKTGDYFYYANVWASTEHFEHGRLFVIDFLIINN